MLAGWVLSWAVGVAAAQGDDGCAWDPLLWWGPRGACLEQCEVAVPVPRLDGGALRPRFQRLDAVGGLIDAAVEATVRAPAAGKVRGRGGVGAFGTSAGAGRVAVHVVGRGARAMGERAVGWRASTAAGGGVRRLHRDCCVR